MTENIWDCDGLNNRSDNLREATADQNQQNQRVRRGRPFPKGVHFATRHQRFAAQIVCRGKHHWLGLHDTAEAAHAAYAAASARLHGDYGRAA